MPTITTDTARSMAARSNAKRSAKARDKAALKTGELSFTEAAEAPHWQDVSALELIGYATIGTCRFHRDAGMRALRIANLIGAGHFAQVSDLDGARRRVVQDQLDRLTSGSRKREGATISADVADATAAR